jgi:hypothetical protein
MSLKRDLKVVSKLALNGRIISRKLKVLANTEPENAILTMELLKGFKKLKKTFGKIKKILNSEDFHKKKLLK